MASTVPALVSESRPVLRAISPTESGRPVPPVVLPETGACLIGRSAEADWSIPEPTVSRRHASVTRLGAGWLLTDLSSRHGTAVNDVRLEPATPVPIELGDVITLGSWRCRCEAGDRPHGQRSGVTTSFEPVAADAVRVQVIPSAQLGGVAQRGLDALMELTAQLEAADSREDVARGAVTAVSEATGCGRVVLVEPDSDTRLLVLASTHVEPPRVSRSLIEQAASRGLVQLVVEAEPADQAQSIIDLGIRSAICAPVLMDDTPTAFLMLDTRDAEAVMPGDAAAFCQAVVRLTGLAMQRLAAASMAERHRRLRDDLDAARRAQELLSPPRQGRHGPVAWRFESIPGRVVAGDLFDVFALDDRRVACILGDVSGKGVGAAMLMAACQSQLRSQLLSGAELSVAMARVNADLHARTESSKFVTLVAAVVDGASGSVQLADAGHGLALRLRGGAAEAMQADAGFPLGVVADATYEALEFDLAVDDALVFLSDGAVEQPDPGGRHFGLDGVQAALAGSAEAAEAVQQVVAAVRTHGGGPLADDLTVGCVWRDGNG